MKETEETGEIYHTKKSAADFLNITRYRFTVYVQPYVSTFKLPTLKRVLYKQSEIQTFRQIVSLAR